MLHAKLVVPPAIEIGVFAAVIEVHMGPVTLVPGRELLQQFGLSGIGCVERAHAP